jgi:hypothetical protein
MLGERDGNDQRLAEGEEDNNEEYGEDSDIPNDDDKYAAGVDSVGETDDQRGGCATVVDRLAYHAQRRRRTNKHSFICN